MARRDEFDDPEGFFSRLMTDTDRRGGRDWGARSLWISVLILLGVVALSGVIWASYPSQNPILDGGAVPIIRAEAGPYKYVPADRGGMAIAYQGSTVFDAMHAGKTRGVENLLSDTREEPVDRTALFAGLKTDVPEEANATQRVARMEDYTQERPLTEKERRRQAAARNRAQLAEPAAPLPGDVETSTDSVPGVLNGREVRPVVVDEGGDDTDAQAGVAAPPIEDLAPAPAKEKADKAKSLKAQGKEQAKAQAKTTAEEPQSVPDQAEAAKTAAPAASAAPVVGAAPVSAPSAPSRSVAGGGFYVQVASVPAAGLVTGEWSKLTRKFSVLAGQAYRVKTAVVRGQTMHRVQVGPMSLDAAKSLCDRVKAKKPGGCLVVK